MKTDIMETSKKMPKRVYTASVDGINYKYYYDRNLHKWCVEMVDSDGDMLPGSDVDVCGSWDSMMSKYKFI